MKKKRSRRAEIAEICERIGGALPYDEITIEEDDPDDVIETIQSILKNGIDELEEVRSETGSRTE
jgi:glycerol dehydrogenase-like iron-containing ADH family enzyme